MQNCNNIEEVRTNINSIDEEIVKLIAKRGHFVKQAAKFKKDTADSVLKRQKTLRHSENLNATPLKEGNKKDARSAFEFIFD